MAAGEDGRSGNPSEATTDDEEEAAEWVGSSYWVRAAAAAKGGSVFKRVSVLVLAEGVRGFR